MNAVMLEPLFGQSFEANGHRYAFDWDGVRVDDGPTRSYLKLDARDVVTMLQHVMDQPLDGDAERAVALAASAMGLSPFENVPTRTIEPVIGETGPIARAREHSVREARQVFEGAVQALGLEMDRAEERGTTLLVRADLPGDVVPRLAGPRIAATIGKRPDSWAVVTPQPHDGDMAALAAHLERTAREGRLQSVTVTPGPATPVIDVGDVTIGAALAYGAFLAPEVLLSRMERDPAVLQALMTEISVPSALAVEGSNRAITAREQQQRTQQHERERGRGGESRER